MSHIYLFTGENTYTLREEKIRWISEFVKKHGEENLVRLQGKGLTFRNLLDEIAVAPFIATRRLVVLEGVPTFTKEQVQLLEQHIHPQVLLLIIEPTLDKRLASAKQLLMSADVKEFPLLKGKALVEWMQSFLLGLGTKVEPRALTLLVELLGEDQDMLVEELKKLALFSQTGIITSADVEETTLPSFEGVIWKLTDLVSAGKREEALLYAHRHIDRGGDSYGLWAVLLGMLKNVVSISMAQSEGRKDLREISNDLQMHFFVVRTLLPYASRIKPEALSRFLSETIDADVGLKTGAYRATDEAPQELLALIDRFILTAPR